MTVTQVEGDVLPVVLLDLDGVIANFTQLYLTCVKEALGMSFDESKVTEWDIGDALGLTPEGKEEVHKYLYLPGMANLIHPYPGAVEAVKKLTEMADVFFVTAPLDDSPTWVHDRNIWLKRHFGDLGKSVGYIHDKYRVAGHVLIDDKPKNLELWKKQWPMGLALLWDQPYNRQENPMGCLRVYDWPTVFRVVKSFSADVPLHYLRAVGAET